MIYDKYLNKKGHSVSFYDRIVLLFLLVLVSICNCSNISFDCNLLDSHDQLYQREAISSKALEHICNIKNQNLWNSFFIIRNFNLRYTDYYLGWHFDLCNAFFGHLFSHCSKILGPIWISISKKSKIKPYYLTKA